jgi:hypothetical protein
MVDTDFLWYKKEQWELNQIMRFEIHPIWNSYKLAFVTGSPVRGRKRAQKYFKWLRMEMSLRINNSNMVIHATSSTDKTGNRDFCE